MSAASNNNEIIHNQTEMTAEAETKRTAIKRAESVTGVPTLHPLG